MHSSPLQETLCLIGQPVAGNPTQYMLEKAFAHHGLDWRYLTVEVPPEALADAVRGIRALRFRGGNVTKPHKQAVVPLLDGLSDAAEVMGAVNCLHRQGDQLWGENTDGKGFLESLRGVTEPAGKRVVLLGAGGAARAIAVELAQAGVASILVVNRTPSRGEDLATLVRDKLGVATQFAAWGESFALPPESDVIINATSVGLNDATAIVPVDWTSAREGGEVVVADVIASPPNTRFLAEARDRGHRALDGVGMIVNQAAIAFRLWTGIEPERAVLREAVEEFVEL